jgi:hypothetical protein
MTHGKASVFALIALRKDSRSHPRKEATTEEPFTSSRKGLHHDLAQEAHPIVV